MKPAPEVAVLDALIGRHEAVLAELQRARAAVMGLLGSDQPPAIRQVRVGRGADRRGRAMVRRRAAKAAKALRTPSGRRRAAAPGSLADRVLEVLNEAKGPIRKKQLLAQVGGPEPAVMAEVKRLRVDGQVVTIGATASIRYAVPKFAKVIVAEDGADNTRPR